MRAITFQDVEHVAVETVADPELRHPGDAIVRVQWTSICGSDLHVYHGRERGLDVGTVLGHEFVGEVVDAGSEVGFATGTTVVAPFTTSCGRCFYCRRGLTCRCTDGELFGWVEDGHGLHGAQAEYVRVPLAASTLVPVPDAVPHDLAIVAGDVMATGFFCAEQGGVRAGDVVAVLGCGAVGLMAVLGALRAGARAVVAVDPVADRRAVATRFGATALDVDAARRHVADETDGRGADVVLEVVGTPCATRLAYELLRPGGVIAAVGVHTEAALAIAPGEAYDKNITYRAGRCPARHLAERMLALLPSLEDPIRELFTHRFALEDGAEAYAVFAARTQGCLKTFVSPAGV